MYKFFLYFKKVIVCLTILFLSNLLTINFSKANKSSCDINVENCINIEIPPEDIKNISIIGYKFVYQTYNASLVEFLQSKIDELIKELTLVGIKEKNIVILYTNYSGRPINKLSHTNYKALNLDTSTNFNKYITDEQVTLNLTNLLKSYSLPFLTAKRNILIGTLVDDTNLFTGNDSLKVVKFNFTHTKAINLFKSQDNTNENKDNTTESNNAYSYKYEERILYRANMISYMNLNSLKNTDFIGMMEYYDTVHNGYAYFALPGKLNDFLYPQN